MACKLCRKETRLVRAHVIPRSFYGPILEDEDYALQVTNNPGHYARKLPIGLYDRTILCGKCEGILSPFDQYGHRLLLRHDWVGVPRYPRARPKVLLLEQYDYHKLKLFFMSVVWRIGVSSQQFFGRIDLGPHEDAIRERILDNDPGDANDFGVLLAKFRGPAMVGPLEVEPKATWLNPDRTRFRDINFVRLWLADFCVYVKMDSRPFDPLMATFCMAPGQPLMVFLRDFAMSKELAAICKMARSDPSAQ